MLTESCQRNFRRRRAEERTADFTFRCIGMDAGRGFQRAILPFVARRRRRGIEDRGEWIHAFVGEFSGMKERWHQTYERTNARRSNYPSVDFTCVIKVKIHRHYRWGIAEMTSSLVLSGGNIIAILIRIGQRETNVIASVNNSLPFLFSTVALNYLKFDTERRPNARALTPSAGEERREMRKSHKSWSTEDNNKNTDNFKMKRRAPGVIEFVRWWQGVEELTPREEEDSFSNGSKESVDLVRKSF